MLDILLYDKSNISNFSNLTFLNTSISDIIFSFNFSSFKSLKFTFSNIEISLILLWDKFNISNLSNSTFSKMLISDIRL